MSGSSLLLCSVFAEKGDEKEKEGGGVCSGMLSKDMGYGASTASRCQHYDSGWCSWLTACTRGTFGRSAAHHVHKPDYQSKGSRFDSRFVPISRAHCPLLPFFPTI